MSDINWKDGTVCYANCEQWFCGDVDNLLFDSLDMKVASAISSLVNYQDFKLNEMRIGDYIEKSELDTEQKYNDVVEVFGLFGFYFGEEAVANYLDFDDNEYLSCCDDGLWQTNNRNWNVRQLTYNQLMRIGELKRLTDEKGATTFNVESVKPMTAICDSDLEKYKESVRAMETLGYKWCDENKAWYQEIKEWVR